MSSFTTSDYRLEELRRERLEYALNERLRKFSEAVEKRNQLVVKLEQNRDILICKLEKYRKAARGSGKVGDEFDSLAKETQNAVKRIDEMLNMPERTFIYDSSESTYCAPAEKIYSDISETQYRLSTLLKTYSGKETSCMSRVRELRYQAAVDEWKSVKEQCSQKLLSAEKKIEPVIAQTKGNAALEKYVKELEAALDTFSKGSRAAVGAAQAINRELVEAATAKVQTDTNKLLKQLMAATASPLDNIRSFDQRMAEIAEIGRAIEALEKEVSQLRQVSGNVDIRYEEYKEPDFYDVLAEEIREKYNAVLDGIEDAVSNPFIQTADQLSLLRLCDELLEGDRDAAQSKTSKILMAEQLLHHASEKAAAAEKSYSEYVAAFDMLSALHYAEDPDARPSPKDPECFMSAEEIDRETLMIRELLVFENENAFIREQISRIMQEFGYQMKSDLVLNRNQTVTRILFENPESKGCLCATYSPASSKNPANARKGFMLEVVGVKETDRSLDGVNAVEMDLDALNAQPALCEEQYKHQVSFCKLRPAMERRFREEGIILDEKRRFEPEDRRYKYYILCSGSNTQTADSGRAEQHRMQRPRPSEKAKARKSTRQVG